jgi:hypothetical protein
MLLALAVTLPTLFWDAPPDTAATLREAGITEIRLPAGRLNAWRSVTGISVSADPADAVHLLTPGVNYRMDEAGATRAPWLLSSAWKFLRAPQGPYYYDSPGKASALAAAEAFSFDVAPSIRTDAAGLKPLAQMLEFLRAVDRPEMSQVADIGLVDDGTPATGELMNMLLRDNLLFRRLSAPDTHLKVNVRLGTKEYPVADAKNPGMMAKTIRANLNDDNRSLRIYGSLVVVGRVARSPNGLRVHLLNYDGTSRQVNGLRVRVLGRYAKYHLASAGSPGEELLDYTLEDAATEFTLPELKTYAVIDLTR